MAEMVLSSVFSSFSNYHIAIVLLSHDADGTLQIGLRGEILNLHTLTGTSSVEWQEASQNQPLIWYKVKTLT